MFQFKNANIIHDTPAGLTEYNFQTMDIDDFIRWALTLYRFAQSKDIDREAMDTKSGVMFLLRCIL